MTAVDESADGPAGSGPDRGRQPDELPSARRVAWARRRAAGKRTWNEFRRHRSGMLGLVVLTFFVLVAIFAPLLADSSGLSQTRATGPVMHGPMEGYPLGTDESGRSVLTLLIWGSRVSLFVGILATAISMVIGTVVGIASGHYRGWLAAFLFRFTEWNLVIPFLPLAIVLATVLGPSMINIAIVIGVTSWPATALLIRSQTLSIESRPYMERAKVLGAGDAHQMARHVLPNVMPMVFANTTLTVAIAILEETTLSFLGLGDPSRVSWGTMLDSAFSNSALSLGAWWFLIPPGICVIIVVLSFTLIGQALEEIFNPRLRNR
jgi:peptide/nickel transport system permease protein